MIMERMALASAAVLMGGLASCTNAQATPAQTSTAVRQNDKEAEHDRAAEEQAEGKRTFRFDTFGDEDFWGGTLRIHEAIEGAALGGVGAGVSPKTALAVGLKVDVDALSKDTIKALEAGKVNLDDPAGTLAPLNNNAGLGPTRVSPRQGGPRSIGIQCGLCPFPGGKSPAPRLRPPARRR